MELQQQEQKLMRQEEEEGLGELEKQLSVAPKWQVPWCKSLYGG
jgi:hypothetical protein